MKKYNTPPARLPKHIIAWWSRVRRTWILSTIGLWFVVCVMFAIRVYGKMELSNFQTQMQQHEPQPHELPFTRSNIKKDTLNEY